MTYPLSFCPESCIPPSPGLWWLLRSRNPTLGHPYCRNRTLLETITADGYSCSRQLGWQPPAPTHQPHGSGVLRKERISEDFNAGLGCSKFSLSLLPPAQPVEASRRSPVWVTAWDCPSGWPRPLLDLQPRCLSKQPKVANAWGCAPGRPEGMGTGPPWGYDSQPTLSSAVQSLGPKRSISQRGPPCSMCRVNNNWLPGAHLIQNLPTRPRVEPPAQTKCSPLCF